MKRSFTPTRINATGNEARVQQLTGLARKLLGSVEARKKRFGLGYGFRRTTLSDGSTIAVTSFRGKKANVTISATTPAEIIAAQCTIEEIDALIDVPGTSWFRTVVARATVHIRYTAVQWIGVADTEYEGQNHTEIFGKLRDENGDIVDGCGQLYYYDDDPYVDSWGPSMAWLADKIATDPAYYI